MSSDEQQRARQGILLAIAAYTMWGIAPIYFKSISDVSPLEILSHRVIWSVLLLAGLLHLGRRWHAVRDAVRTKRPCYTFAARHCLWESTGYSSSGLSIQIEC
ncbi:protein rarD [Vibrio astriarenae]|nr:protein rarD [Vibrio sp. C7]